MHNAVECNSAALAPASLNDLLGTFSIDEFFENYWTQQFLNLPSDFNRFAELCSWNQVNEILTTHTIAPSTIRLIKAGVRVPSERFIDNSKPDIPRIRPKHLLHFLSSGAMLTLNHIEAAHKPISVLAQSLERTFQSPVVGVFCANFRSDRGLDLHWDDQEVFVLQIEGRKHWKVYQPTTPYPCWNNETSKAYPTDAPVFDGILEAGSLLYMPRGWWHVAEPLNEPSLHLSLGIKRPSGADLIQWVGEQMKHYVSGRRDIPHYRQNGMQAAFLEDLRSEFDRIWNGDLIEMFLRDYSERCLTHPSVALPELTTPRNDDLS